MYIVCMKTIPGRKRLTNSRLLKAIHVKASRTASCMLLYPETWVHILAPRYKIGHALKATTFAPLGRYVGRAGSQLHAGTKLQKAEAQLARPEAGFSIGP